MNLFDVLFAKKLSGGGKPALVPWATGTDDQIVAMVNGYYDGALTIDEIKSVWSIGDCRSVDLAAMEAVYVGESHRAQTVELQILGFEHDTLTTTIGKKTKALITVDLKNCLRDATVSDTDGKNNTEHGYMNDSISNTGGWTSCKRRTWCNDTFYNALPQYIKDLVKHVDKLTSAGIMSPTINTDSDRCFLLSEIEIFGNISQSTAGEGVQYGWFANAESNRYKFPKWDSGSPSDAWWERSPYIGTGGAFCYVEVDGSARSLRANAAMGIAPAFCL